MIADKVRIAVGRINQAIELYSPIKVYGLFSGGHDSFSSTYVASLADQFDGVVHINTGIGIEATRDYVRQTCRRRDWKLLEYKAVENRNVNGELDPQVYSAFVREYGFPGPAGHQMMYNRLKERGLRRLARDAGATCKGKVKRQMLLVSGCRSQESERRMAHTEELQLDGRRIWCAAIHDWSKLDTSDCLEYAKQPRSEVVDLIHKSGECLCGAFAKPGELEELALWPLTRPAYDYIIRLQAEVQAQHPWGWGQRPPRKQVQVKPAKDNPLCWSCERTEEPK